MIRQTNKYIYETNDQTDETIVKINPKFDKERKHTRYEILRKFSDIPALYDNLDFNTIKTQFTISTDSLQKCIKYSEQCSSEKFKNVSLYLWGPNTTAKTTVACAIGREFMRNGLYVKFVLAGNLISYLMSTQGFNKDVESDRFLKEFDKCDLIIIDDAFDSDKALLWQSANKGMIVQEWDRFYRHYISLGTRFIVTSNKKPDYIGVDFSKSLLELIDRNFAIFEFADNIKHVRKNVILDAFK